MNGPNTLPRYWISRAGAAEVAGTLDAPVVDQVLDCFRIGAGPQPDQEWVVVADRSGNLGVVSGEHRHTLPPDAREALDRHELGGSRRRRIEVAELYLFNLQLLEQPAQAPGPDDPVYLYGTLFGPFPAQVGCRPAGVEGQLTVTRGDLLDGLARGAEYAFQYPPRGLPGSRPQRCFHLLLPADTVEEIHRARGLVLAYPMLPAELPFTDPGNEMIVEQLFYDVLKALRDDLEREGISHPLRSRVLPVPSRYMLEQRLAAEGYEIRGDTAVRKAARGEGFAGALASVFGSLMSEYAFTGVRVGGRASLLLR